MKRKFYSRIILLVFTLIGFLPFSSQSQWQQVTGLNGEPVYWVRGNGTKLWAMTLNGVLQSNNNGASWAKVPALYLTNVIERMSASGDTIVMYASPDHYVSTDNGNTWIEMNALPGFAVSSDVIVEQGRIYQPTYNNYLYLSLDGGNSWVQISSGLTTPELSCISAQGNTIYVGTDDGVFKSTDGGLNFSFSGLSGEYINRIYNKGNYVFAYGSGIFRSDDNGANWAPFEPVIPYAEVLDFYIEGNKVFAATGGELISSNIFLPNWTPVVFTSDIDYCFSVSKNGTDLFLGCNRGVYSSNNSGISWNEASTGIIPVSIRALTIHNNDTLYAGASIHGVSKYSSGNWTFSGLGLLNTNDLVSKGTQIYASTEFGINRSNDGGITWELLNINSPGGPVVSYVARMAVVDSLVMGAALQNGILRSGDFGLNWSLQSTGLAPSLASCVTVIGNVIIAGTFDNGLFRSTDFGLTWVQTGAVGELINDITVIGNVVVAANGGLGGTYRSTDQGLTWTFLPGDYFDDLSVSGPYLLASGPTTLYLSVDQGQTYAFPTPAPTGTAIASNAASVNEVFIGTYQEGVWKTTFFDITGLEAHPSVSLNAVVAPNLFSEQTVLVADELFINDQAELFIYDMNGRLVYRNKILSTQTILQGNQFESGMYFYYVRGKEFKSDTGKLIRY
jgi:photosystem II stability/assembly factor-like uncharacterized protein